jgi:uncharacterized phage-associated protein
MKNIFEACVQTIHFLLKTFGEMDKLKVVKLIYLADKYHLVSSLRTITGDNYVAMRHGPVGSMGLNVLNRNTEYLEPDQLDFIDKHIRQSTLGKDDYKCAADDMRYGQLSDSDKNAITKIGWMFKNTDKWDLVELTHKYPEWVQFERDLEKDPSISKPIKIADMFSCLHDDPLGLSVDDVTLAYELYFGIGEEDPLDPDYKPLPAPDYEPAT